jgi:hypothetical protein
MSAGLDNNESLYYLQLVMALNSTWLILSGSVVN